MTQPTAIVFYDGHCGLCHRTVRWLLWADPRGQHFVFAPLGGETFAARIDPAQAATLPDSVVVRTADGQVFTRWRAIRWLLARLGGPWRLLGWSLAWLPNRLGDAGYDAVAALRHRLFAPPPDACPLVPPALRPRLLP